MEQRPGFESFVPSSKRGSSSPGGSPPVDYLHFSSQPARVSSVSTQNSPSSPWSNTCDPTPVTPSASFPRLVSPPNFVEWCLVEVPGLQTGSPRSKTPMVHRPERAESSSPNCRPTLHGLLGWQSGASHRVVALFAEKLSGLPLARPRGDGCLVLDLPHSR